MSRKNKSVSFNEEDPEDIVLLEHAEEINPRTGKPQNFSKYVKRLIREEIQRKKAQQGRNNESTNDLTIIDVQNDDDDETYTLEVTDEDIEAMESLF